MSSLKRKETYEDLTPSSSASDDVKRVCFNSIHDLKLLYDSAKSLHWHFFEKRYSQFCDDYIKPVTVPRSLSHVYFYFQDIHYDQIEEDNPSEDDVVNSTLYDRGVYYMKKSRYESDIFGETMFSEVNYGYLSCYMNIDHVKDEDIIIDVGEEDEHIPEEMWLAIREEEKRYEEEIKETKYWVDMSHIHEMCISIETYKALRKKFPDLELFHDVYPVSSPERMYYHQSRDSRKCHGRKNYKYCLTDPCPCSNLNFETIDRKDIKFSEHMSEFLKKNHT